MGIEDLGQVLNLLGPHRADASVLVGLDQRDDAAVINLGGPLALVLTTDFFTPVVDDAYTWGRIAAANAMSDVYAMGGRPMWALNLVGWPRETLPLELLADVLRGGADMATEAGMSIVGGHTVDDPEPKYGMAVVGTVDPERSMKMDAARAGDVLLLTKPIGTGIATTALKKQSVDEATIAAAVSSMTTLNDRASIECVAAGVKACTDVTGFGLVGHLHRMCLASGVAARISSGDVRLLPGVGDLVRAGMVPGGTERNMSAVKEFVTWNTDDITRTLMCDAQTSGGLLIAADPTVATDLAFSLDAAVIGEITSGRPGTVEVS